MTVTYTPDSVVKPLHRSDQPQRTGGVGLYHVACASAWASRQNSMRGSQYQRPFVMDGHLRMMPVRRVSATLLLGVCLCLVAAYAHSQPHADSAYTEVFYPSGSLRIQAYLYKPHGDGPFPVVIYNH